MHRKGADLSHVICSPTAAGAIKSYSPDLIVHPILREELCVSSNVFINHSIIVTAFRTPEKVRPELDSILSRLHILILGPGLGREDYMQSYARVALSMACSQGMFVVLDADSLWMVNQDISVIKGYRRAVLTPNVMEFKRLSEALSIDTDAPADKKAGLVSKALGGVTIVQKGAKDIIAVDTTGEAADPEKSKVRGSKKEAIKEQVEVDTKGGYKRCGGQGDILSGVVGTMLAWGKCYEEGVFGYDLQFLIVSHGY
jgi:ATP-dependent NAD(P)H-hydrate dehydratase